jgi:beta-glucosidase-like glycosyl hydrolase
VTGLVAPRVALAMTAHVVFSAVDPKAPATLSRPVVDKIVRGHIRFDGALMTDDICMGALSGDAPATRARREPEWNKECRSSSATCASTSWIPS